MFVRSFGPDRSQIRDRTETKPNRTGQDRIDCFWTVPDWSTDDHSWMIIHGWSSMDDHPWMIIPGWSSMDDHPWTSFWIFDLTPFSIWPLIGFDPLFDWPLIRLTLYSIDPEPYVFFKPKWYPIWPLIRFDPLFDWPLIRLTAYSIVLTDLIFLLLATGPVQIKIGPVCDLRSVRSGRSGEHRRPYVRTHVSKRRNVG